MGAFYHARMTARFPGVETLAHKMDQFPVKAAEFAHKRKAEMETDVLTQLRFIPGPPAGGFRWSEDQAAHLRAARWWFWAVKTGLVKTSAGHYARTGTIAAGWEVMVNWNRNQLRMAVANSAAPGMVIAYIYGSMSFRSLAEAKHWQIPGHQATGWPFAAPIVRQFFDDFTALWMQDVADYFHVELKPKRVRRSGR